MFTTAPVVGPHPEPDEPSPPIPLLKDPFSY
jgi:hypothetical protein